ncbi:MAG: hypothetical protein IAF58_17365 [Leptolyngbya sp.]|nr:hypothetical protein [Candidatus Melainabacteria bacterium]
MLNQTTFVSFSLPTPLIASRIKHSRAVNAVMPTLLKLTASILAHKGKYFAVVASEIPDEHVIVISQLLRNSGWTITRGHNTEDSCDIYEITPLLSDVAVLPSPLQAKVFGQVTYDSALAPIVENVRQAIVEGGGDQFDLAHAVIPEEHLDALRQLLVRYGWFIKLLYDFTREQHPGHFYRVTRAMCGGPCLCCAGNQ